MKVKKYIILLLTISAIAGFFLLPKDANLTDKLPLITSHTTLDAEYLEGGNTCFQWTTVIPDKFSAKTRMDCNK